MFFEKDGYDRKDCKTCRWYQEMGGGGLWYNHKCTYPNHLNDILHNCVNGKFIIPDMPVCRDYNHDSKCARHER